MKPPVSLDAWVDVGQHREFSSMVTFLQWAYEATCLPTGPAIAGLGFGT